MFFFSFFLFERVPKEDSYIIHFFLFRNKDPIGGNHQSIIKETSGAGFLNLKGYYSIHYQKRKPINFKKSW